MHTFTSTWTPERIDNTERAIRAQRHDETSLLLVLLISPKTLVDSQVGSQRKSQPITHINLAKKTPNQKNPLLSLSVPRLGFWFLSSNFKACAVIYITASHPHKRRKQRKRNKPCFCCKKTKETEVKYFESPVQIFFRPPRSSFLLSFLLSGCRGWP